MAKVRITKNRRALVGAASEGLIAIIMPTAAMLFVILVALFPLYRTLGRLESTVSSLGDDVRANTAALLGEGRTVASPATKVVSQAVSLGFQNLLSRPGFEFLVDLDPQIDPSKFIQAEATLLTDPKMWKDTTPPWIGADLSGDGQTCRIRLVALASVERYLKKVLIDGPGGIEIPIILHFTILKE